MKDLGEIMNKEKHLSLRINSEVLKKFRYICSYEGRSANSQLLIFIRDAIIQFEKEHGAIDLED